ncbi:protein of unknown function DUF1292 [Cyanobacterium stanieri PCC 7202]|uniref:DUF3727 domain-containing protein n=1 Tax=Cyanobacterium stanieri (strain ATCC 29140 / PCC 7202) TaxID=292563 RepID=K9YLU6_CYASC|nr:protein of unknown function DUF1292 [Cyanobacterium stanieri PCC 7202]
MSPSQFSSESGQYDDKEIVIIHDDQGQFLECYVENEINYQGNKYLLLTPVDNTIVILTDDMVDEDDSDYSETVIVEDDDEIDAIFDDAKAVLGELNLSLKRTGITLTAGGDLPPEDDENIIRLELDDDDDGLEVEELQFLASFYSLEQRYDICTPLAPILFIGEQNSSGKISLFNPEKPELQGIIGELLSDLDESN